MPFRYQRDGQGRWRCPPGEVYAEALGLTYRVISSASVSVILIQNLRFLHNYWASPPPVPTDQWQRVIARVREQPGIRLMDLLDLASLDVLYALIASEVIWADLSAMVITRHADVLLYPDAASVPTHAPAASTPALPTGMGYVSFTWDGRVWVATT
jgi:putative transposase